MSREPSDKTKLRTLRRELLRVDSSMREAIQSKEAFRARATKAEQEVSEWKARFDALLAFRGEKPRPEGEP